MNKNRKKGFTLVELLVVIAILAILAVVSVVGYTSFTKKAKIADDISLTTQLNTILQANEATDGKNKYPHEAALELVDGGYDVTKITPTAEKYNYVYDLNQNRMFLLDESYNVVSPSELTLSEDKVSVFGFAGSQTEVNEFNNHGYSVYLKSTYVSSSVTTSKGVDVGNNENVNVSLVASAATPSNSIKSNSLKGTRINTAAKNSQTSYVVRTNGGILTINNSEAVVSHFGTSTKVEIKTVAKHSEYGKVEVLIAVSGTVVAESGSTISTAISQSGATIETEENSTIESKNENVTEDQINKVLDATAIIGVDAYDSLEDAITAAKDGNIVKILKDINISESIKIEKKITIDGSGLTIAGSGYSKYDNVKRGFGINITSNNVTIKNVHITDMPYYASIECAASNILIDNVLIDKIGRMGIDIKGNFENVDIKNCHIDLTYMQYSTGNGIQVQEGAKAYIHDTIVESVSDRNDEWASTGICVWEDSNVAVDNCIFKNCENVFGLDNSGKNDPISLTVSNSTITNCDYAFIASTGNGLDNKFNLTLNGGNNFDVKENIGRFANSKNEKKLEANIVINGGSYKANEGKGILFVFADNHDEWKELITANITINGGSLSGTIVEARANSEKIDLPSSITTSDKR